MIQDIKELLKLMYGIDSNTVDILYKSGFLTHQTCMIYLVKFKVDELYKKGTGKVEAIQEIADRYNISYESARKYVYGFKDIKVIY
jgi:hypothetical protein